MRLSASCKGDTPTGAFLSTQLNLLNNRKFINRRCILNGSELRNAYKTFICYECPHVWLSVHSNVIHFCTCASTSEHT